MHRVPAVSLYQSCIGLCLPVRGLFAHDLSCMRLILCNKIVFILKEAIFYYEIKYIFHIVVTCILLHKLKKYFKNFILWYL